MVLPNQLIESNDQFINLTTNILVVMETYLFPCNDMQVLAEKLVTLERLQVSGRMMAVAYHPLGGIMFMLLCLIVLEFPFHYFYVG